MNKKHLCITGAAGFVGTAFWRQYQDKYRLSGFDRYGYASHIDERQGSSIWNIDCNSDALQKAMRQDFAWNETYDAILHLAASTHNDNSLEDPLQFYKDNVLGTVSILEAARVLKIPKVYCVVTDEVLAHSGPFTFITKFDEYHYRFDKHKGDTFLRCRENDSVARTKYSPTSPYSSSKACQEMIINAYRESYGLDIVVIRPTNIYGPYQHPEKLVSKSITNALRDEKIPIYGLGMQWRDYTYITDTCRALDLIIDQEKPKPLYHISANDERQNIDTVREILYQLEKPSSLIQFIEDPRGNSHDFSYSLSSQRVRDLGWVPEMSFEAGIASTIKYYKERLDSIGKR